MHPDPNHISLIIGKSAIRTLRLSLAQQLAEAGIHIATVTIGGIVQVRTHFDPDALPQARQSRRSVLPDIASTTIRGI
jgi:NAD(P)-dependent dehydrogenase (short-subunit alcohol dehydrogenase family)